MKSNRMFFTLYVLLVGLPILAVLGILEKGRSLKAPLSVDGTWKMETIDNAALPCGKSSAETSDLLVAISQSGQNFTLRLSGQKLPVSGTLDGTSLTASGPSSAWPGENTCAGSGPFSIRATVDPNASPRSIRGIVSLNDCAACTPVEFHAYRQPPPPRGGH